MEKETKKYNMIPVDKNTKNRLLALKIVLDAKSYQEIITKALDLLEKDM